MWYVHMTTVCVVCAHGYSVQRVQQGEEYQTSGAGVTDGCELLVCTRVLWISSKCSSSKACSWIVLRDAGLSLTPEL